jgi:hypothetical protein
VGNFNEEHKVPKRVETQYRRYSNPRRVGKEKLLDPISRQMPTKAKRHTQPTQLRTPHNPHGNEEWRVESKIHKQPASIRKEANYDTWGHIQERIKDKYAKPNLNRQGLVQEL